MQQKDNVYCGGFNAGILKQLGNALHRLETTWMHSAERSRCFEINTPSEDEGVARMQSVQLNSGKVLGANALCPKLGSLQNTMIRLSIHRHELH